MGTCYDCIAGIGAVFDGFNSGTIYDGNLVGNTFSSTAHDSGVVVSVESTKCPKDHREKA
ncbi:MAG: hypothetical protein WCI20_04365 [bacterium]